MATAESMNRMSFKTLALAMAILTSLGMASTAPAQNALGAGDALDANTQVGSGGRNARSRSTPTNADFRDRNYIVTDSVAGGRGFRGNVGYRAPGDFTGNLGSDDSKGFRSYSALSDLIFITSPQMMDSFNIAQGTGVFEFRRDFSTLPEANNIYAARRLEDAQIRLDRSTLALSAGTLYATAVDPADVGFVDRESGRFRVTTSPLEGLGTEMMNNMFDGYTLYDRASAREGMARSGMMNMTSEHDDFLSDFDRARMAGKFEELEAKGESPPEQLKARIAQTGPTTGAYQEIVNRVMEKYADRSDITLDVLNRDVVMRETGEAISRLDAKIVGLTEAESRMTPLEDRIRNTDEQRQGRPGGILAVPSEDSDVANEAPGAGEEPPSDSTGEDETPAAKEGLTVAEMAEILRHRTEISELSISEKTRLARTVKQGEEALQAGRFFKAERRFDDALRINPGNPLLELARANAQIGAGLYLSAALTLKRAFTSHPEVIDSRFKPQMLPTTTRLEFSEVAIRERIERGHDVQGYGLTMAYIGVQLGDDALVREGLSWVKGEGWDVFGDLLRGIWLGDTEEPDAAETTEDAAEPTEDAAEPTEDAAEGE